MVRSTDVRRPHPIYSVGMLPVLRDRDEFLFGSAILATAFGVLNLATVSGWGWIPALVMLPAMPLRTIWRSMPALVLLSWVGIPTVIGEANDVSTNAYFVVIVALSIVAADGPTTRDHLAMIAFLASPLGLWAARVPDYVELGPWTWMAGLALGWLFGAIVGQQWGLIDQLADSRTLLARAAVMEERQRIARELHDLVGHSFSVVLLHLGGARAMLDPSAVEAATALRQAEEVGRRGMDDLRQALLLMRTDAVTLTPVEAGGLPRLIGTYTDAGMQVDLTIEGDGESLHSGPGIVVHDIVREALTNVAKHARRPWASIALTIDEGVTLRVENELRAARRRRRARAGSGDRRPPTAGRGGRRDVPERAGGRPLDPRSSPPLHPDGHEPGGDEPGDDAVTGSIRVVLVDDQPLIRAGLKMILGSQHDIQVVAECDDGAEVGEVVAEHRPDLVCMDVRMPIVDGIRATAALRASNGPPVLVLTTFGENEILWAAVEAGANGFELKSATPENLVEAVRTVARGGAWIDGSLLGSILESYRSITVPQQRAAAKLEALTDRELEVLRLMARGATNTEIAGSLFVAETTVKTHVGSIFSKLGVRDRAAAIVYAFDTGVVRPRA